MQEYSSPGQEVVVVVVVVVEGLLPPTRHANILFLAAFPVPRIYRSRYAPFLFPRPAHVPRISHPPRLPVGPAASSRTVGITAMVVHERYAYIH